MQQLTPHLRTSERISLKRCPQQWQWAWRNGLHRTTWKPDALWFGTGIHLALQERYKYRGLRRGGGVLKVWRDYAADMQGMVATLPFEDPAKVAPEAEWVGALELGEAMLGAYLDKYGKDERWFVLSAEQTFSVPISRPATSTHGPGDKLTTYNGTFDLVALDQADEDSAWLWDHKTAKVIQTGHLALDDQAGAYWAFAADVLAVQGLWKPGTKLSGILYNYLRKAKTDERPRNAKGESLNKDGTISKQQPSPNFYREDVWRTSSERKTQIERIQGEAMLAEMYKSKSLPIIKNPTKDCQYGCEFFEMCQLHENGDDWQSFRDQHFTVQDPYADHRKAATS